MFHFYPQSSTSPWYIHLHRLILHQGNIWHIWHPAIFPFLCPWCSTSCVFGAIKWGDTPACSSELVCLHPSRPTCTDSHEETSVKPKTQFLKCKILSDLHQILSDQIYFNTRALITGKKTAKILAPWDQRLREVCSFFSFLFTWKNTTFLPISFQLSLVSTSPADNYQHYDQVPIKEQHPDIAIRKQEKGPT